MSLDRKVAKSPEAKELTAQNIGKTQLSKNKKTTALFDHIDYYEFFSHLLAFQLSAPFLRRDNSNRQVPGTIDLHI